MVATSAAATLLLATGQLTRPRPSSAAAAVTIKYRFIPSLAPERGTVMFLPGLLSDWNGGKARVVELEAAIHGLNYLACHYEGHGIGAAASTGSVADSLSVTAWKDDVIAVVDAAAPRNARIIIVGSSLGAWLALHVAAAMPKRVHAAVLLAPAVDATQRWRETCASVTSANGGDQGCSASWARIPSEFVAGGGILLRREAIEDANRNLTLLEGAAGAERARNVRCGVWVMLGERDNIVPASIGGRLQRALVGAKFVEVEVRGGGDHRLSRPEDLERLRQVLSRAAGLWLVSMPN